MTLTELSIKRPSLIIVIFTILIGGGLICYNQLSYELMPDFAPPVLTVTTTYPGASPATVESQVSKPLEDGLSGIENLSEVTTFSFENASIVLLEFKDGVDINQALQEAQRKINTIEAGLPKNSSKPVLAKIEPNAVPVLQVIATSKKLNSKDFTTLMEKNILPQIKQVAGVADVQTIGGEKREIKVDIDKEKLKAYGLTLVSVNQILAASNVDSIGNSVVHLSDVADIHDGTSEQFSLCRLNGQEGIGLRIKKQSDANAVSMSQETQKKLKQLEEKYADIGLKFTIATDTSNVTLESVDAVIHDLELAVILVAIVMLLFLHTLRNALIVLVSIPASLISTFIAMYALGYTLNLMTLLAMSLVIGILVDDSIVVLENIYRHIKMGKNKRQAAIDGRNEIGFTALAITLVDVVVFSPVVFIEGIISDILQQFSIVVVISTLMSLFVCFTLTPWLASRMAKEVNLSEKRGVFYGFLRWFEARVNSFTEGYAKLVDWSLKHKIIMGLSILGLTIASFSTMGLGIVGQEFVSQGDQGKFMLKLKFDKSTTIEQNNQTTLAIEDMLNSQKEITEVVFSNVGGPSSGMGATTFGSESKSEITVKLKPNRSISTVAYMTQIREKIESTFPGVEVRAMNIGMIESEEAPIEIFLSSDDNELMMKEARRLKNFIDGTKGAKDAYISTDELTPELRISLDRVKMGQLGLQAGVVGMQLQNALTGNDDVKFDEKGQEYAIRVMLEKGDRQQINDIESMTFTSSDGKIVRLEEFAKVSVDNGNGTLERKNRANNTTLRSWVLGRASGDVAMDIENYLKKEPLDPQVKLKWGGEVKRQKESMGLLGTAMGIGLILVYLIMVVLYDNFIYPFVVLFSIFVSLVGAILALNLSSSNMGVFTMLGMLMLLGLVAKNAILIVDFANQLKLTGLNTRDALLESVRTRMRPILMTTIAMVFGMIPIAMATGSGAEWKNGLAWVLIGGLTSSMFLTILVVPMMYSTVDNVKDWLSKRKLLKAIKLED